MRFDGTLARSLVLSGRRAGCRAGTHSISVPSPPVVSRHRVSWAVLVAFTVLVCSGRYSCRAEIAQLSMRLTGQVAGNTSMTNYSFVNTFVQPTAAPQNSMCEILKCGLK
jgi:hypothetical protein